MAVVTESSIKRQWGEKIYFTFLGAEYSFNFRHLRASVLSPGAV